MSNPPADWFCLSEKEKALGFEIVEVEVFDPSEADCFKLSIVNRVAESDAIFRVLVSGKPVYSHRRWGKREGCGWEDWTPINTPYPTAEASISGARALNSDPFTITPGKFRFRVSSS